MLTPLRKLLVALMLQYSSISTLHMRVENMRVCACLWRAILLITASTLILHALVACACMPQCTTTHSSTHYTSKHFTSTRFAMFHTVLARNEQLASTVYVHTLVSAMAHGAILHVFMTHVTIITFLEVDAVQFSHQYSQTTDLNCECCPKYYKSTHAIA